MDDDSNDKAQPPPAPTPRRPSPSQLLTANVASRVLTLIMAEAAWSVAHGKPPTIAALQGLALVWLLVRN